MPFSRLLRADSLRMRVLLAFLAGTFATLMAVSLLVVAVFRASSDVLVTADIEAQAEDLIDGLRFDAEGRPARMAFDEIDDGWEVDLAWMYDVLRSEMAWRVLAADGRVVLSSPAEPALWAEAPQLPVDAVPGAAHARPYHFRFRGQPVYAADMAVVRGGQTWLLQVATTRRLIDVIHRGFTLPLLGIGVTIFSLSLLFAFGVIAYFTLRYALRPLQDLSRRAAAISPRSLAERLPVAGVPAEIAPLVDSFNRALDRIEQGYRVQQEFLSVAAHELKTPLALVRGQIELQQGDADKALLLSDLDHMSRQIQQLLLLAETSEARNYEIAQVDVRSVAEDVQAFLQPMADGAGVQLDTPPLDAPADGDGACWPADRSALFTLLKNLVENAIQHAPAGSRVEVSVTRDSACVRDRGPGVPAAHRERMFERFWRGEDRRDTGAGLGLAICKEIAQAHGWTLTATAARPGLRVCVRRPPSPT